MSIAADDAAMPLAQGQETDAQLRRLFDAARDGDQLALGQLCTIMRPRLYRVAFSVVRHAQDADDVAQEALVRAITKRFLFLGTGSVGGWMTRIAINLAKNRRRNQSRRRAITEGAQHEDLHARGALQAAAPNADDLAVETEQRQALLAALATLPERQRDVMQLRAIAGLDFRAVGETLGISEENARVTFSNARKKLIALLTTSADGAAHV